MLFSLGCGNDDDDDNGNNNGNGNGNGVGGNTDNFSVNINGEPWKAERTSGSYQANFLSITGSSSGAETSITLSLLNVTGPGTYPLIVPNSVTLLLDGTKPFSTALLPGSAGDVNITEISGQRVKGTFDFTAATGAGGGNETVTATDGTFDTALNNNPF